MVKCAKKVGRAWFRAIHEICTHIQNLHFKSELKYEECLKSAREYLTTSVKASTRAQYDQIYRIWWDFCSENGFPELDAGYQAVKLLLLECPWRWKTAALIPKWECCLLPLLMRKDTTCFLPQQPMNGSLSFSVDSSFVTFNHDSRSYPSKKKLSNRW